MTLGAAAPAAAQADFGKPHPPIVPEDDPAITVVRPQLSAGIPAYAAMPKNVTPATPGIVQVLAIWGIDAQLRDVVRRYAKAGYICIAPDIYARDPAPNGDGNSDIAQFQPAAAPAAIGSARSRRARRSGSPASAWAVGSRSAR